MVEFSLLLGFIALFSVALYGSMHTNIATIWDNVSGLMAIAAA